VKYVLLVLLLAGFASSPVLAQNSCDSICSTKCSGQGATFRTCYESCKSTCVPKKTGDPAKDKANICENRCAGKGAAFKACYDSCIKN
jgi:hypothetical protein